MNAVEQRDHFKKLYETVNEELHKSEVENLTYRRRIDRLESWIAREGVINDHCTFFIINKICDGCRCGRREK